MANRSFEIKSKLIASAVFVLLNAFSINLLSSSPISVWENFTALPEPNGGFVLGSTPGCLYIAGGTNWSNGEKEFLDEIWCLNLDDKQWVKVCSLPYGFGYGAGAIYDGKFFLVGGTDGKKLNDKFISADLDVIEGIRTSIAEQGPLYAGYGSSNENLYVIGGSEGYSNTIDGLESPQFLELNLKNRLYKNLPDYIHGKLLLAAVVVSDNGVYVFGGTRYSAESGLFQNTPSAAFYDFKAKSWMALTEMPYAGRGLMAVELPDGNILIGGGCNSGGAEFTDAAYIFDVSSKEYISTIKFPVAAMSTIILIDDYIYMIGGEDKPYQRSDKIFRISVEAFGHK